MASTNNNKYDKNLLARHTIIEKINAQLQTHYSYNYKTQIRPYQIDFLFNVTRAHARKVGALNLFIQKWVRRFYFIYCRRKKITLFIHLNFNYFLFE